jgi:glycosyltransferase involved in cell wall biosynthesis
MVGQSRATSVVIVISNLEYGGAQRQVVETANHMDAERFDVHICSLSDYVPLADTLRDRDRRLHIIRKRWKYDLTVIPRLARLLRGLQARIVHSYLFDADIAARLAGRIAGTPLIVGSERNTDYHLKRRQLITYRLTKRCVDLIIANSQAGADFNSRVLGHDPSLYRVVHNGVDTARFSPGSGDEGRRELGIEPDERVVGMFASFKEQKNHAMLLAAAPLVLKRFPRTRFLVVGEELYQGMHGSDEYKRNVEELIDRLGVRER